MCTVSEIITRFLFKATLQDRASGNDAGPVSPLVLQLILCFIGVLPNFTKKQIVVGLLWSYTSV